MRYQQDDIFSVHADHGAVCLVNTVNCVGVMGKGLAKAFAVRFPAILAPYQAACRGGVLRPGRILETRIDPVTGRVDPAGPLRIVNFPTKDHWRDPSRLEWIDEGLKALNRYLVVNRIPSVAVPQLGCGLGGLDWNEVAPLIEERLAEAARAGTEIVLLGPEPVRARGSAERTAGTSGEPAEERRMESTEIAVREFQGENRCFSNMYRAPVMWGDEVTPPRMWPCNEVAYVAAKSLDPQVRAKVLEIYEEAEVQKPGTGSGAVKRFGRTISLRSDWDAVKDAIMLDLVRDKVARNPAIAARLRATGKGLIQEGNWWGDVYWGVSLKDIPNRGIRAGQGKNTLGKIWMRVRDELERGALKPVDAAAALKGPVAVVNMKAVRRSRRDPLPDDVLDISRYGTESFNGIKLGNPYVMDAVGGRDGTREDVIRKHAEDFAKHLQKPGFIEWLAEKSAGKRLGCFCKPHACHGDTIKAAVDAYVAGRDPVAAIAPFRRMGLEPAAKPSAAQSELPLDAASPTASGRPRKYAGIGSRETPAPVLAKMEKVAEALARRGWTLRSGGAPGADSAFEKGAKRARGSMEIYLPCKNWKGNPSPLHEVGEDAMALAASFHPAWERCGEFARKLHGRNGYQVLGRTLDDPVDAVICWTEGGQLKGGTSQALRIAAANGVQAINLGADRWKDASVEEIVAAAEKLAAEFRAKAPAASRPAVPAARPAPARPAPAKPALSKLMTSSDPSLMR